jgi:hypothetical protein
MMTGDSPTAPRVSAAQGELRDNGADVAGAASSVDEEESTWKASVSSLELLEATSSWDGCFSRGFGAGVEGTAFWRLGPTSMEEFAGVEIDCPSDGTLDSEIGPGFELGTRRKRLKIVRITSL